MRYRFEDIAINSTEKKKPAPADKDVYLGLEHLDSGSLEVTRYGSEVAPIGEKLIMKKGDVLFGKRRAYQKKVAVAPFDGIFSAHGMVLRPKEAVIDRGFFPLFISSDYFLDAAVKISVGSLSPTINWRDLKELTFHLPPLEAQQRIAAILWAGIETRNAYKELLALTEQLVKSRFVEMFGDPVTNPMGWEVCKLGDVAEAIDPHPSHRTPPVSEEGIPYIGIAECNYQTLKIDFERARRVGLDVLNEHLDRYSVDEGDFIIGKIGTIGRPFFIPPEQTYTLSANTVLIKPKNSRISPSYLLKLFQSDYIENQITSERKETSQPALGIQKVRNILILLPPLSLQTRFADFVRQADKSKFTLQQTIDELEATYKSLLRENLG